MAHLLKGIHSFLFHEGLGKQAKSLKGGEGGGVLTYDPPHKPFCFFFLHLRIPRKAFQA